MLPSDAEPLIGIEQVTLAGETVLLWAFGRRSSGAVRPAGPPADRSTIAPSDDPGTSPGVVAPCGWC